MQKTPDISAVQQGERRVEYRARTWSDWIVTLVCFFCVGMIGYSLGHAEGVGTGIEACKGKSDG